MLNKSFIGMILIPLILFISIIVLVVVVILNRTPKVFFEPSGFEHLETTCYLVHNDELCQGVHTEIIKDRITPTLSNYGLTFIDYLGVDRAQFSDIADPLIYDMPPSYERAKYISISYHMLVAKDDQGHERMVYLPFEKLIDDDVLLYHYPLNFPHSYEMMLIELEAHLGAFMTFDYQVAGQRLETYRVVLSEMMFQKTYKQLLRDHSDQTVIKLQTATSLWIYDNEAWLPHTSSYKDGIVITIIYDGGTLIIINHDGFILEPEILFEFTI
jgi:hypothetical protein